ncbi:MAG: NUDIX domain-containing protein [Propionibacteriaceae bacterium]|nr:NUDIX domain-containing protein [Propionibacteriaceae bacterium]
MFARNQPEAEPTHTWFGLLGCLRLGSNTPSLESIFNLSKLLSAKGRWHDGKMQIIGVLNPAAPAVFSVQLAHGADPHQLAYERGFRIIRPLSVNGAAPDINFKVQLVPVTKTDSNSSASLPTVEVGLPDEKPEPRQRIAAYAIVLSARGLLATEFSDRTAVSGQWGLPGGGIQEGETPSQAVIREAIEETGQSLELTQLIDIQTDHWVGLSPFNKVEDFHAVRIIYTGLCPNPRDIVINDTDGTTSAAAWIELDGWGAVNWTRAARTLLNRHMGRIQHGWDNNKLAALEIGQDSQQFDVEPNHGDN